MFFLSKFFKKKQYLKRCIEGVHYKKINHLIYKYEIIRPLILKTKLTGYSIEETYFSLNKQGVLKINIGYMSDGPSGPTLDTPSFMRGSFFHDALYQMLRMRLMPKHECNFDILRKRADLILIRVCKEDGMILFRRQRVYWGLRIFGRKAALPNNLMQD